MRMIWPRVRDTFSSSSFDEYSRGDTAPLYQPETGLTNKPSQSTVVSIKQAISASHTAVSHQFLLLPSVDQTANRAQESRPPLARGL
jgi:hypothetical protein